MALSRKSARFQNAIWPGFVDAMTGLLLVLMFVLTIFMVIQFTLRETITGQESELDALSAEVEALSFALGLEQERTTTLMMQRDADQAALAQAQEQIATLQAGRASDALMIQGLRGELSEASDILAQERRAAEEMAEDARSEQQRQAALLALANTALSAEQAQSVENQRQVARLNAQVAALRREVGTLKSLLDAAGNAEAAADVEIAELGAQLNSALARVAAEERRRRALEEAERRRLEDEAARLAARAQNLERFRSDFFGELRALLEGQDGVQIVGDRFVFSSEVLFSTGAADLSPRGRTEIDAIADILRRIADDIPQGIDWIIRVDGHTDNVPVSGNGAYRSNWELSQARALSVVQYMIDNLGMPPDRLAANGFGEFQPLDPANTARARASNRRIEVKLTER